MISLIHYGRWNIKVYNGNHEDFTSCCITGENFRPSMLDFYIYCISFFYSHTAHVHWRVYKSITMWRLWTRSMLIFTSKTRAHTSLCIKRFNILWDSWWLSRVSSFAKMIFNVKGCGSTLTCTCTYKFFFRHFRAHIQMSGLAMAKANG